MGRLCIIRAVDAGGVAIGETPAQAAGPAERQSLPALLGFCFQSAQAMRIASTPRTATTTATTDMRRYFPLK